jgi:putative two-component system response regulator
MGALMHSESAKKILIVDDDRRNREFLKTILSASGYLPIEAENGMTALEIAGKMYPDLILLDCMMPDVDGFYVSRQLKEGTATRTIPVIMITGMTDRESKLRALENGVEDFLSKPIDRAELQVRVKNLLRVKEYSDFLANYNHRLEQEVAERSKEILSSYFETVLTITRAAEYRDEETGAHIRRIGIYTRELAQLLGLSKEFVETIATTSPLHDVGKIGIPDHILFKPSSLLPDEQVIMKSHARLGAEILGGGKSISRFTKMGAEIARSHHEKWDGSGYPDKLKGEEIPLSARIMSITDVYDALRSRRPYKPPFSHQETCRIILEGDGRTAPTHFDPPVLEIFRKNNKIFEEIFESYQD